jgi:hypothetical protein
MVGRNEARQLAGRRGKNAGPAIVTYQTFLRAAGCRKRCGQLRAPARIMRETLTTTPNTEAAP